MWADQILVMLREAVLYIERVAAAGEVWSIVLVVFNSDVGMLMGVVP